jgi:hypothetical protein
VGENAGSGDFQLAAGQHPRVGVLRRRGHGGQQQEGQRERGAKRQIHPPET